MAAEYLIKIGQGNVRRRAQTNIEWPLEVFVPVNSPS